MVTIHSSLVRLYYLGVLAKAGFEVAPVHGEEMQKIVERIMSTPKELAARAKHLVE